VVSADPLLDRLRDLVGTRHVLTERDVCASYETDWTQRYHSSARAVVRPADPAQVRSVLACCSEHGAPVVPQGGNTGLVGGSVPRNHEVLLSLRRLQHLELDPIAGEAVVGAGVTLGAVQDRARVAGWDVGVDIGARDTATIGGMVATNAGGLHLLRYGPMADQVLGCDAALVDGTRIGHVPALRKDNTGYRWERILTGSEGTLAVLTTIHLRLVPYLSARVVALAALETIEDAVRCCSVLRRRLPSLVALEACLADGIDLVCAHTALPQPFAEGAPVVLLAECAGQPGEEDRLVAALGNALGETPEVRDTVVASAAGARARLWRYREAHTEAVNALGIPHKLDVTLPASELARFARDVHATVAAHGPTARLVMWGHLGDGNLHVNVIGPEPDDTRVDDAVLDLVIARGGSISAEHGIGVAKRAALARARPATDLAAMRAVKQALDPSWLLNPGALLNQA